MNLLGLLPSASLLVQTPEGSGKCGARHARCRPPDSPGDVESRTHAIRRRLAGRVSPVLDRQLRPARRFAERSHVYAARPGMTLRLQQDIGCSLYPGLIPQRDGCGLDHHSQPDWPHVLIQRLALPMTAPAPDCGRPEHRMTRHRLRSPVARER